MVTFTEKCFRSNTCFEIQGTILSNDHRYTKYFYANHDILRFYYSRREFTVLSIVNQLAVEARWLPEQTGNGLVYTRELPGGGVI